MKIPSVKPTARSRKTSTAAATPRFGAHKSTGLKYKAKGVVFRQGTAADAVYFIEAGGIELSVVSKQGKHAIVGMLGAGQFFGVECLAGQALHFASATARVASSIVKIDKEKMTRVLQEQPEISKQFMAFLLTHTIEIQADLVDQMFNSSERRLARLLLLLANVGKEKKIANVIPHISQDALAAKVGTTRSRINFFMNKFRKLGFIEYNGGLKVNSSLMDIIVEDEFADQKH